MYEHIKLVSICGFPPHSIKAELVKHKAERGKQGGTCIT